MKSSGKHSAQHAQHVNQAGQQNQPKLNKHGKPKKPLGLKIAIGVAITLVVCAVALVVGVTYVDKMLAGNKTQEELDALNESLKGSKNLTEPFYCLLIGSDTRTDEINATGDRSDVNILVRVDPQTYTVTMVSIQRDTKTTYNGYTQKFNGFYSLGGAAMTVGAASKLTGVDISYYAEINFHGVIELIDALGGVDVNIAKTIDDWWAGDEVIEAGWQHLNGEQALIVARARHYGDGDYTRSSYQRVILQSVINKILAANPTQIPGLLSAGFNCVNTSFKAADIYSLALQFKDHINEMTFYSANLPSTTGMEDGISYVYLDETLAQKMMDIVDAGGNPSTLDCSSNGAVLIESSVLGGAATYDENGNRTNE